MKDPLSLLLPEAWGSQLSGVEVFPDRGEWVLHLQGARTVAWEETARRMAAAVPGLQKISLAVVEGGEEVWPAILSKLRQSAPGVCAQIAGEPRLSAGELRVPVVDGFARELLGRKGLERMLAGEWEAATGEKVVVRLVDGGGGAGVTAAPPPAPVPPSGRPSAPPPGRKAGKEAIWGRFFPPAKAVAIREGVEGGGEVILRGRVVEVERKTTRRGLELYFFTLTDLDDSVTVRVPAGKRGFPDLSPGRWVRVKGMLEEDPFRREIILVAAGICAEEPPPERTDEAADKRIELHLHTRLSAMDAVCGPAEAVERAARFGHPAVAITDHGVVQAFPEAWEAGRRHGVKVILGLEAYLLDPEAPFAWREEKLHGVLLENVFTVVDVETTGLSPRADELLEIGAVRVAGGTTVGEFHTFLRPEGDVPAEITRLTGITTAMVRDAPPPAAALADFLAFAGDTCLVAHNAPFDLGFLGVALRRHLGADLGGHPALDTLGLSRVLYPKRKTHRLDALAKEFNVPLNNHHRAGDDARATAEILLHLLREAARRGCSSPDGLRELTAGAGGAGQRPFHAVLLVRNGSGLRNLYHLVSESHLQGFQRVPRITRGALSRRREGLLVGSACREGELWEAFQRGADRPELERIGRFYDYLEIQPVPGDPAGRRGALHREIAGEVCRLGERMGIPVVATGNVHYLEPEEVIYRRIITAAGGGGGAEEEGWRYFRTTAEMLAEFAYLGEDEARRVVIDNPERIAAMVENVPPVPEEVHAPEIPGAAEVIRSLVEEKSRQRYGSAPPAPVSERLDKEMKAILGHGFAGVYQIARQLVNRSLSMGYLVGSRGSVGSSLVANLCGITEVNPLPPHYLCPACHHTRFVGDGSVASGYDLPRAACPECGTEMTKDGQDIPFETFLGFEGDKVPDIDLNFAGEAQGAVHRYAEELLGKTKVYRAGTISTLAQRTACGLARGYLEGKGRTAREAEIRRLAGGITGVKRTTGQHPGGLMIVPEGMDIHRFTPIQRPADAPDAETITTHFDYHAISSRLLKLDLLGHDDPTTLRLLEEATGVAARTIPLDDPATLGLFSGTASLGVADETIGAEVGTLGIPEFGTRFVRGMLKETKPASFGELVRISGLSHGTDVWSNNAQNLVREKTARLSQVIATRDDIMLYLIQKGLAPGRAFAIMESVRKGKGLSAADEKEMKGRGVPGWYVDSCRKISYMFPKAHAAAYCMMAFRIAWYKVHHPAAFYAAYFTVRSDDVDAGVLAGGPEAIGEKIAELGKGEEPSAKDKAALSALEVAREAWARGVVLLPVDLYRSDPFVFRVTPEGLRPPFIALQGLGKAAAVALAEARAAGPFTSLENLRERAGAGKKVLELLDKHGSLRGLAQTNQLTFG